MGTVIFNTHDMVLAMTVVLCCLFALEVVASHKFKPVSAYLLSAFLVAQALMAAHELILYGGKFRFVAMDFSPNLFFIGGGAYYLDGPLLYLYVRSLIYSDFRLYKTQLWHLLPIAVYFIYMLSAFYLQTDALKREILQSWRYDLIPYYLPIEALVKALRFGYLILGVYLIGKYRDRLKEAYSNLEAIDLSWLKLLIIGFLLIISVDLLLAIIKIVGLFYDVKLNVLIYLGLSSYYAKFVLINLLLFFSAVNISSLRRIKQQRGINYDIEEEPIDHEYVQRIERIMQDDKPYLMPNITLDTLSVHFDVPPRELSLILNRHFKMNFYEFINNHRIEESKLLLSDEACKEKTITDIYTETGFNSKSVFNTFFKKRVGMTPSEYRKLQMPK